MVRLRVVARARRPLRRDGVVRRVGRARVGRAQAQLRVRRRRRPRPDEHAVLGGHAEDQGADRRSRVDVREHVRHRSGLLPRAGDAPHRACTRTTPRCSTARAASRSSGPGSRSRPSACGCGTAGYTTAFMGKYLNGYELDPSLRAAGLGRVVRPRREEVPHRVRLRRRTTTGSMEHFGRPARRLPDRRARAGRATEFVDEHEPTSDKPFLLTLFPTAPHSPIEPAPPTPGQPVRRRPDPRPQELRRGRVRQAVVAAGDLPGPLTAKEKRPRRRSGTATGWDRSWPSTTWSRRSPPGSRQPTSSTTRCSSSRATTATASAPTASRGSSRPTTRPIRVPLAIAGPGVRAGRRTSWSPTSTSRRPCTTSPGCPSQPTSTACRSHRCSEARRTSAGGDDFLIEYKATARRSRSTPSPMCSGRVRAARAAGRSFPTTARCAAPKWLYVEWYAGDRARVRALRHGQDPYQLTNLLADLATAAEHAEVMAELQARLEDLAACSGAGCR